MLKQSGGIKMINDLSWVVKKSINKFLSPNDFSLSYTSFDMAVQCIQLFDDTYISKEDIADAVTHIIVHPSDYNLVGLNGMINIIFQCVLYVVVVAHHFYITNLQMHLNLGKV